MSTSKDFAQEVADAFGGRDVTVRPMFGEYGFYCENKMVGLICDNTLFFKITPVGQDFAPELSTGSPYPGAKAQFVIPAEKFHESEWLNELLQLTWDALPFPKPKPAKNS